MIIIQPFYGIKCNRCENTFDDGDHSFWPDETYAIENATDYGWATINDKHYCPNCHKKSQEIDEIKVLDEYPQELKTLNEFIDKILKGVSRTVLEYEDNFVIKYYLYFNPKIESFDLNYIKSLLGEKFISLTYEEESHNRFVYTIKLKNNLRFSI